MSPSDHSACVDWQDDATPVSRRFGEAYFSSHGGLAESRHVFLAGNDLPARFARGFHIAELGFGTGLNMLAAWQSWQRAQAPGPLRFTSFEAYPMRAPDMRRALAEFTDVAPLAAQLLEKWPQSGRIDLPGLRLEIISGDARMTLPNWSGRANAWFLDGFSPARNPELWGDDLLGEVTRHTAPNGSFATYSAAGKIRRALAKAGFDVQRTAGFARKRHMSTGTRP